MQEAMVAQTVTTAPPTTSAPPPPRGRTTGSVKPGVVLARVLGLGLVLALAASLTPSLVGQSRWGFLVVVWVLATLCVASYATGRLMPAKYLLPGTVGLFLFLVFPILLTAQTSTTNFGDGTRTSKQETIDSIVAQSVTQSPDSPRYNLSVATSGSVTTGPFTFFLVNPKDGAISKGTTKGVDSVSSGDVTLTNKRVTAADGFKILTPQQLNAANKAIQAIVVPTQKGAIKVLGIRTAFEGETSLKYDAATDTITDTKDNKQYKPVKSGDREFFTSTDGSKARLSDQSWKANVGLENYRRVLTDSQIRNDFSRIFIWTLVYAILSVALTFMLGLALAVTLNDSRVRGQRLYRTLLLLPYAIPGFISLLVWAGFFNQDFGLLNSLTGLHINWFGNATTAKIAVLLTNLWMGFPYMFLVSTGALQSVPADLKEAASIDGASGFRQFRAITFPLLLVTVAPLLVASFAFNFNNYNSIALLTKGGPFDPANPTAGGTDILISYTIRLAFGAGGAQLGFASAVSVVLFVLTGVIATIQFRLTRRLEDLS
jgi:arabinogalactan oligomer / maltooligosaccharide transport system permease protein